MEVGSKSMKTFNSLIYDVPLKGGSSTWSSNIPSSRLDRFLISPNWQNNFNEIAHTRLTRTTSDHHSILLCLGIQKWGPTLFCFENIWLDHPIFLQSLETWWATMSPKGWPGFVFMEKLKLLKQHLKSWNQQVFGIISTEKTLLMNELEELDKAEDRGALYPSL